MKNTLARTSIATLTALTVSVGALAISNAPASAMPIKLQDHVQMVGAKDNGKRGYREQRVHHRHQRLYPQQVVRILKRKGFRNVRRVYYSHGKYYARALGHRGPVKLVISARSGQILSRQRLNHRHRHGWNRHFYGGHPHNGWSWSYSFGR